uniref:ABC transporter domain-containing protein n=1 Tax=Vannella robusta TaxID=1487602 RepID=A0A7S4I3S4_9EUKA|mmetsp:Transcript_20064/g.25385  ORF Transcript_20064/g.25385 Transcript_20064/m.25385 type:complete len:675 (+) Transcript_20064:143-2167(+)
MNLDKAGGKKKFPHFLFLFLLVMDQYVPHQLPFALKAFQLSRILLGVGGILVGTTVLWKLGNTQPTNNSTAKPGRPKIDLVFWKRLYRLVRLCIPGVFSWEFAHLVVLSLLLLSRTLFTISIATLMGSNIRALTEGNFYSFVNGVTRVGFLAIPVSIINSALKYFTNMFALYCRRRLSKHGHDKYLTGNTMYRQDISNLPCDKILTNEIEKFSLSLSNLYTGTFKPLLDVVFFANALRHSVGITGPFVLVGYYAGAGVLLRSVMPSFGKLYSHQQRLENNFQYNHARLLSHTEEIAFYGGNELEKNTIDEQFDDIFCKSRWIFRLQALVNMLDNWLIKYGASIAGYAVVSKPVFGRISYTRKFLNTSAKSAVSERAAGFTRNTHLLVNLASAITQLVLVKKKILTLAGHTTKVSQLFERLDSCDIPVHNEESRRIRSNIISFSHVNVIAPNQQTIIRDLSFRVQPGNSLLIQGPPGSGKTSIFRLLSGIWPLQSGTITKPNHSEIFYIPQHPYFPVGTLKEQIIYPMTLQQFTSHGHHDGDLYKLLEFVHLTSLLDSHGWYKRADWESLISMSDLQRLAVCRIFFHQPRFAILDMAMCMVDAGVEMSIYQQAKEMGITFITVTEHQSLQSLHESVLTLKGNGDWEYTSDSIAELSDEEDDEEDDEEEEEHEECE